MLAHTHSPLRSLTHTQYNAAMPPMSCTWDGVVVCIIKNIICRRISRAVCVYTCMCVNLCLWGWQYVLYVPEMTYTVYEGEDLKVYKSIYYYSVVHHYYQSCSMKYCHSTTCMCVCAWVCAYVWEAASRLCNPTKSSTKNEKLILT